MQTIAQGLHRLLLSRLPRAGLWLEEPHVVGWGDGADAAGGYGRSDAFLEGLKSV